ncbi:glycosyltransferase [Candidatus Gracilibacteria bacterium]|nr:glycosyltransferase [Candidatus Gracilibacteria bacterium]
MKIIIVNDTYHPHVNGCSVFSQRFVHYLKERGHDITVIGPALEFKNSKREVNGVKVYGVKTSSLFFKNDWGFRYAIPWFNKKYIRQIFDEVKPDLLHTQSHFPISRNVIDVAIEKNIPLMGTNHFMAENLVHYLPGPEIFRKWLQEWLYKDFAKIFNKLQKITTPTATAAKLIQKRIKQPVQVISNGIDLKIFNQNLEKKEELNEKYNIPKNTPNLYYVGRLDKEKNLDMVIKSAAIAMQKVPFHLTLTGHGDEKENLKKLAKDLEISDHVTFTGFVSNEDLPYLYKLADCFVMAGTAELQSLVTMEAMATGLPVLGVNAMAIPELVHNGENGFLFEFGEVEDLADKMVKIFQNEKMRKEMSEKSLSIIEKHDIEKTLDEFEEIYKELKTV